MSEVKAPKTKREYATLYRRIADRLESGEGSLVHGSIGPAGRTGGKCGCLYGQAMAVVGLRQANFNESMITGGFYQWVKDRLNSQALRDAYCDFFKKPRNQFFTAWGMSDQAVCGLGTDGATEAFVKILRKAAYCLDHGGKL